jgi:transcriptional regulator with XRE-family HTH domain
MQCENNMQKKTINRLKVVLVEQDRTSKWLSEQLGKDPATISRWCSNSIHPSLEMLDRIAELLDVNRKDLINDSK